MSLAIIFCAFIVCLLLMFAGYTGSDVKTPTLDALAADGVKFSSFYVQRACSPTRAAVSPLGFGFFTLQPLFKYNSIYIPVRESLYAQEASAENCI